MGESDAARKFSERFTEAMFGDKPVRTFEDILPAWAKVPKEGERSIEITCHLCGSKFMAMVKVADFEGNYTLLEDGTYDGSVADHWCQWCDEEDRRDVTRDWNRR